MNYIQELLICGSGCPAPMEFGMHPEYAKSLKEQLQAFHETETFSRRRTSVETLRNHLHPEIILIPRDKNRQWIDAWGDDIGIEKIPFHCSSYDFYVDQERQGLFWELEQEPAIWRLNGLSQLGYLTPPKPPRLKRSIVSYTIPQFHNSRLIHSRLMGMMGEVLLSRNGFSPLKRAALVIMLYTHDIATPAGGDSIKRMDKKNLCEEDNYRHFIMRYQLEKKWRKWGYDLDKVVTWVRNQGMWGLFLDVLDKISYVGIDCYSLGLEYPGKIRSLLTRHPLLLDVWQDLRFTPDKQHFYFCDVDRLFRFLLLRAYEHQELLFNPFCRCLDFFLSQKAYPLYRQGILTKDMLLTHDDAWLEGFLEKHYPCQFRGYLCPDELGWKKFKTKKQASEFAASLGQRFNHCEQIKGFNIGLHFPALHNGQIVPVEKALSPARVRFLESINRGTQGHYVYYKK